MALTSYTLDFEKMIKQLLGYLLRQVKRVAWLKACLKPVQTIHSYFITFTQNIVDEIKWNGQTIKLQELLIEKFGAGIYITNNDTNLDALFVGEPPDLISSFGADGDGESFIGDGVASVDEYSFTVNVPVAITFVESEMRAYINKYKMFGTTYNIVIV